MGSGRSALKSRPRVLARRVKHRVRQLVDNPIIRITLRGRLLEPYWRVRFAHFGRRAVVHKLTLLRGAHKIAIGDGTIILRCWLSTEGESWSRPGPALSIGRRVAMRPFSTIAASESAVIEDDVGIASHSLVTDHDHAFAAEAEWSQTEERQGTYNPIVFSPLKAAPVRIGQGTWIAERVAVLPGAQIGRHCVIGTNSVVRGEIPDHAIAIGAPARVVGSTR